MNSQLRTMPSAVNNLIVDLFERKYRKVGQEKNALGFFFSSGFLLQYRDARKGVLISGVLQSVRSYHMYVICGKCSLN